MTAVDPEGLCAFLDSSPTARHASAAAADMLVDAGFHEQALTEPFTDRSPSFVRRDGSLIAWTFSTGTSPSSVPTRFRMVGAHTDSPGLRIKPNPVTVTAGSTVLGVEVYGGPLLNSWLDRDLGLAGTVVSESRQGTEQHLVRDDRPIMRIPQLAIHLDRSINDKGLVLDRQHHLRPLWSLEPTSPDALRDHVAALVGVDASSIIDWDLAPFDLTPARRAGRAGELLVSARLDDLVGCHCALRALIECEAEEGQVAVVMLVDHEEVGSASVTGAQSAWISQTLERIAFAIGLDRLAFLEALSASHAVSVDMAHATHPNYPERHDPTHPVMMNAGPVVKHNAQQRYATTPSSAAAFLRSCSATDVPVQHFVSHSEMPCGSTIGPALAVGLGVDVVDVGIAQLAMHSVRETCGSEDPLLLTRSLHHFLSAR